MAKSNMVSIGQRIRAARLQRGQTQESLAKAVGKSKQLISAWEGGRAEILASKLGDTAQVLGVHADWILYGRKEATAYFTLPEGTMISKLDPDDVRSLAKGRLSLSKLEKRFVVHRAVSSRAFAVLAVDAGLAPYIERGDLVTVDPEVAIEPGRLGLAVLFADKGVKLPSPALLIWEFWYKTLDRHSRLQLVAKRAGYPNIEIDEKNDIVILGAVVGNSKSCNFGN